MPIPRRDAIYLLVVTTVALLFMLSGATALLWSVYRGGNRASDTQFVRDLIARGDQDAARALLDRLLTGAPDHIDARLLRADMQLGVGESSEAIVDYDFILAIEPGHANARLGRGLARLSLGDEAGALSDLNALLEAEPSNADALHLRAVVRSSRFESDLALADFDAAINRQPDRLDWRLERSEMRRETGRFAEAADDLEFILTRRPDLPDRWSTLAWCRWGAGNLSGAMTAFDESLKLDGKAAHAHLGRGAVLLNLGRVEEAVASLDEARARPDQGVEYAALYAWIARSRLGDTPGADATLRTDLSSEAFPWREWPRRLAAFLLGETSEEDILRLSREEMSGNTADEQRCEALYYAAWKRLLAGDEDGGRNLLQRCTALPLVRFYEWNSARHDLARLSAPD